MVEQRGSEMNDADEAEDEWPDGNLAGACVAAKRDIEHRQLSGAVCAVE